MTPLSDQLLSKLACPKCQGDLKYDRAKEVLDCMSCKLRFQVTDEIPVLLLDEATELE